MKKTTSKCIVIKLLKINGKEKILKPEEKDIMYKRTKREGQIFHKKMQVRRPWSHVSKVLRVKYLSNTQTEMKTFSNKHERIHHQKTFTVRNVKENPSSRR